jgi:CTP:molybdopterin cytidylyltransferase MocA
MIVAAVILAAGGSSRLGRPKQLLEYREETLLNRSIRLAREAGACPVIAILGADYETIRASVRGSASIPLYNDRWRQGIASSIHHGMRALGVCAPGAAGVLLMGCDQPLLTAEHLRALIHAFTTSEAEAIVASAYAGAHGVPAVFPQATFADLRALQGDKGARSIIESADFPVVDVEFTGGEVDIDSPKDLAQLG